MDFVVDQNLLDEAKKTCETTAEEIEKLVEKIYNAIDAMNANWSGESYEVFKSSCMNYHASMEQLVALLRAYAVLIDNVSAPREELENAIKIALND